MKSAFVSVFALVTMSATTSAQAQELNCDKKVESYLEAIGNQDSESYEVIEIQAGENIRKNNEVEYRNSNYRISGHHQSVSVRFVIDAKTCLVKVVTIIRE